MVSPPEYYTMLDTDNTKLNFIKPRQRWWSFSLLREWKGDGVWGGFGCPVRI